MQFLVQLHDLCYAVDNGGAVNSYTGSWTTSPLVEAQGYLSAITCFSDLFCMAGGGFGYGVTYNNGDWTAIKPFPESAEIIGISCASESSCAAINLGNLFIYSDGAWGGAINVDSNTNLNAISCVPNGTLCMLVDGSGYALQYQP